MAELSCIDVTATGPDDLKRWRGNFDEKRFTHTGDVDLANLR
jgi:hypothetical protein